MESTGVYWKPVFYALESDFTCLLVDAAHIKQVPGRKTDVLDCVWIAQLLEHGLLRGSFVPPVPIREVRDLTRYRKALIQDRTRVANRLHKALEDAGVKLASVASDILGVSGRAMLQALAQGTTDPAILADLARGRLRGKLPALRAALAGRFRSHHAFLVGQLLGHLDYIDEAIVTLSTELESRLAPFADQLTRLDSIPGINRRTAEVIIAEVGRRHERLPQRGSPGELGGPLSWEQRERRQAQIGEDPEGQPVVTDRTDRSGRRRQSGEGERLAGTLPAGAAPSRPQKSRGRPGPHPLADRLSRLGRRHRVPRARKRLPRPPAPPARYTARASPPGTSGLPRNPRARGMSARATLTGFSEQ